MSFLCSCSSPVLFVYHLLSSQLFEMYGFVMAPVTSGNAFSVVNQKEFQLPRWRKEKRHQPANSCFRAIEFHAPMRWEHRRVRTKKEASLSNEINVIHFIFKNAI